MKTKILALLMPLLIILAGCTFSTGAVQPFGSVQLGWLQVAVLASLTMFSAIALLYMFSQLLGMPALAAWCRNEIFQVSMTVAMVALLFSAANIIDAVWAGVVQAPPGQTVMQRAQNFQLCMASGLWDTYNGLVGFAVPIGLIQSSTIHIRPLRMGFSIQPATMLRPISDNIGIGLTALGAGAWGEKAEWYLLRFAESAMLTIFLPLGILFRAFPFTRQVGGAMIALAVALYAVYPLTVLMNEVVYAEHYGLDLYRPSDPSYLGPCDPNHPYRSFAARFRALGGSFWEYLGAIVSDPGASGFFSQIFGVAGAFLAFAYGGLSLGGLAWLAPVLIMGGLVNFSLAVAKEIAFLVIVMTIFLSVIDWMIVFTFARSLAQVLGSDLDLSALLKLL